jgi:hypothetical protein
MDGLGETGLSGLDWKLLGRRNRLQYHGWFVKLKRDTEKAQAPGTLAYFAMNQDTTTRSVFGTGLGFSLRITTTRKL